MNILSPVNEVLKHPKLSFDRSFSERGTRQLIWLAVVVIAVFALLYVVSFFCFPFEEMPEEGQMMGRFLRMLTLFIDPSAVDKLKAGTHGFGIVVAICDTIVITGKFISVFTVSMSICILSICLKTIMDYDKPHKEEQEIIDRGGML